MPSFLPHAARALSISPRCGSMSEFVEHAASASFETASSASVPRSFTDSGPTSVLVPLHQAGTPAPAGRADASKATAHANNKCFFTTDPHRFKFDARYRPRRRKSTRARQLAIAREVPDRTAHHQLVALGVRRT